MDRRQLLAAACLTSLSVCSGVPSAEANALEDPPIFRSNTGQFMEESPPWPVGPISEIGIDGRRLVIGGRRSRPQLVSFWASWCLPCRKELPMLQRLLMEHPDLVDLVAISTDALSLATVRVFLDSLGVHDLPAAHDPNGQLWRQGPDPSDAPFVIYGMPISFLLDRKGRVTGSITGDADWTSPQGLALLAYYGRPA